LYSIRDRGIGQEIRQYLVLGGFFPLKSAHREAGAIAARYFGSQVRVPLSVDFAMRYGEPSIAGTLARAEGGGLRARPCAADVSPIRASTTASALDE